MEADEEAEYLALFERESDLPLNGRATYAVVAADGAWESTDMGTVKSCAGCDYPKVAWYNGYLSEASKFTQAAAARQVVSKYVQLMLQSMRLAMRCLARSW